MEASAKTRRNSKKDTKGEPETWRLRLYITGMTPRSQEALRNVEKICREYFADKSPRLINI